MKNQHAEPLFNVVFSLLPQEEFAVTERYVTMSQLCSALKEQRVKAIFGSGTASMICPIGKIVYQGEVRDRDRAETDNMRKASYASAYRILNKNAI